ncbi:MAG: TSUP family transporter [Acutalibacteraceae bacterium]
MGGVPPYYKMSGVYIAAAGIVSGILGAMGMGGGGVLVIVLTVFCGYEQTLAQGINLIFFVPCAVAAIIIYSYKKLIDWKIAIPFSVMGCIGAVVGSYLTSYFDNKTLSLIFGIMLLVIGVKELFSKTK